MFSKVEANCYEVVDVFSSKKLGQAKFHGESRLAFAHFQSVVFGPW